MRPALLLFVTAALAACRTAPRASSEERAYDRGAADEVRRLYWAKQALERARAGVPSGRTEFYTWEDRGPAADGRRLAPETVAVPVFVPAPLP